MFKKAIGAMLLVCCCFLLASCRWSSRANRKELLAAATQTFKDYGFKGQVQLEDYSGNNFLTAHYQLDLIYQEEVDGRLLYLNDRFPYWQKHYAEDYDREYIGKTGPQLVADRGTRNLVNEFYGIADQAMWQQSEGQEILSMSDDLFKTFSKENLTYKGSLGSLDTEAEQIEAYYEIVEQNRAQGKPVNGLYDIPIRDMMANEVVVFHSGFDLTLKSTLSVEESILAEEATQAYLAEQVRQADLSRLPDGHYTISFTTIKGSIVSGGIGNQIAFDVRNHKMQNLWQP